MFTWQISFQKLRLHEDVLKLFQLSSRLIQFDPLLWGQGRARHRGAISERSRRIYRRQLQPEELFKKFLVLEKEKHLLLQWGSGLITKINLYVQSCFRFSQ